jgi:hypothetical protein
MKIAMRRIASTNFSYGGDILPELFHLFTRKLFDIYAKKKDDPGVKWYSNVVWSLVHSRKEKYLVSRKIKILVLSDNFPNLL